MNKAEILETMDKFIKVELGRPRLRVLYVTSPPWGVFEKDNHDKKIGTNEIAVQNC